MQRAEGMRSRRGEPPFARTKVKKKEEGQFINKIKGF